MTYETVAGFTQSLSLVIFFSVFLGVLVYIAWPGNRAKFDKASRIPLESDEHDNYSEPGTGGLR